MGSEHVVFLDLETTGLAPDAGILEAAMIIVNLRTMAPVDFWQQVIVPAGTAPALLDATFGIEHPDVVEMHKKSGLLMALVDGSRGIGSSGYCYSDEAQQLALDWLEKEDRPVGGKYVLAGFSPHADRRWLEHSWPKLYAQLHHRMIDVSTVRRLVEEWRPLTARTIEEKLGGEAEHRAMGDCQRALAYLRTYGTTVINQ